LITVGEFRVDRRSRFTSPVAFSAIDKGAKFADQMCRCFGKQIAADEPPGWDVTSFRHDE
jgi:hypothetical protein